MLTRRESLYLLAAGSAVPCLRAAGPAWDPDWDSALLEAALQGLGQQFDAAAGMLSRKVGGAYNYHSTLRNVVAHPVRESLEYAHYLLEAGQDERARLILERVLPLQDADSNSKWYGLWGYYLEEPPPQMSPADWNWADFNGATLLMIAFRHGSRLPATLLAQVRAAIRHAAQSVRRRNVSMTYTNIAVKGTFVTLAAAELLDDGDLGAYAKDRLQRLASAIDETGSFAEYNSPTYARVTIANLTRMRMTLKDRDALAVADRIHHRAWRHLGEHWHAPTRQLAGPHSRTYSTDIGEPVWVQKALGGKLEFAPAEKIRAIATEAEAAVLDYRCPEDLHALFLNDPQPHTHREIFLPGKAGGRPVAGTTYLEPAFCLGSVNRGDFWVQRRPLLLYYAGAGRQARYAQLRFLKDDYDFSSALLYSVQERSYVLGVVNFRSPGGDRHISLDPIENGEFAARRFRLRLDLVNPLDDGKILANGKPLFGNLEPNSRLSFDLGDAWLHFQVRGGAFGKRQPRLSLNWEDGVLALSYDLQSNGAAIRWSEMDEAWIGFTLAVTTGKEDRAGGVERVAEAGRVRMTWKTPAGELGLRASTRVAAVEAQDAAFEDFLNGAAAPLRRLSDEKLGKG